MRRHRAPLIMLLLLAIAVPTPAQTQTVPIDTNQPNSAPLAALRRFLEAMLNGDEKTAFTLISYAKPENRQICETILAEAAARHRTSFAIGAAFKNDPAAAALQSALMLNDETVLSKLDKAKVAVKLDSAEVAIDATMPAFEMVKKDGKWLLDFEKTQTNAGPLPKEVEVADSAKRRAAYDQIAAGIKAKKFGSVQAVGEAIREAQVVTTVAPAGDHLEIRLGR